MQLGTSENQNTPSDGLLRRYGRTLWISGAVVILLAALALWWWLASADALRYVTARVTRGDLERAVSMTGALNPVVTAQVGSYVSGNIKSWTCDYNTLVKIGQSCAKIDPLPFQVIVDQDTADVNTAIAQLAKDKAAAANQAIIYDRDKKLIAEGIVSQETLDTDKATLDQDLAQNDLDVASLAEKRAALHAAQVNLDYTNIVSPVDGMVITRYIDVGQTVVSSLQSSTLFLIGRDMHKMQVDTNVSEADVGEVQVGQSAHFTVQAYPERIFVGKVRQIREGPITVQNVVTYDVVIDVDNDDLALYPGMTADAHIVTAERHGVLRVPLPAVRFNPEGFARESTEAARKAGPREAPPGSANPAAGEGPKGERKGEGTRGGGRGEGAGKEGGRGPRPGREARNFARIWLLHEGKLTPVRVRTGLDDGTLIEVSGEDLKPGDVVVVNAVHPNAPRPDAGANANRPGANPAAPRQGGGGAFRQ